MNGEGYWITNRTILPDKTGLYVVRYYDEFGDVICGIARFVKDNPDYPDGWYEVEFTHEYGRTPVDPLIVLEWLDVGYAMEVIE